jgi:hypothetical protein
MGVDLTLMPLIGKDYWAAHTQIDLGRNNDLWDRLMNMPTQEIPKPLCCYKAHNGEGATYGDVDKSPYGERLTFATVADLLKFKDCKEVQDDWENRAAWAYLEHMPPDWKIVLYWH